MRCSSSRQSLRSVATRPFDLQHKFATSSYIHYVNSVCRLCTPEFADGTFSTSTGAAHLLATRSYSCCTQSVHHCLPWSSTPPLAPHFLAAGLAARQMCQGNGLVFNVHGSGELRRLLPLAALLQWCCWLVGESFASLDLAIGVCMLTCLKWAALHPPPQLAFCGLWACDQKGLAFTE